LDDVSDGNQYLCITEIDVNTDKVEMKFYGVLVVVADKTSL